MLFDLAAEYVEKFGGDSLLTKLVEFELQLVVEFLGIVVEIGRAHV